MTITDPAAYLAEVRADYAAAAPQRAAEAAAREAARKARTPAQRRADYIECQVEHALEEADEGPTSYPATYWHPSEYTAYGEWVVQDAAIEADVAWDCAVVLWNATPGTEDGDEKYVAVRDACGEDLAEEMIGMEIELGVVR